MSGSEMKGIFVVGTDTGVGKTVVSGLLGNYLLKRGYRVITQKWVQTGDNKYYPSDVDLHLKLMKIQKEEIEDFYPYISIYNFGFAASPHLASALDKRRIEPERIKKSFKFLSESFDCVIVEGSGGALVPFNRKSLLIDIAQELNLAALIVAANKLGAINHSLLTVEALKRRRIEIIGIIFNNQSKKVDRIILEDNPWIVQRLSGVEILGVLPYLSDKTLLCGAFNPIGRRIAKWMIG